MPSQDNSATDNSAPQARLLQRFGTAAWYAPSALVILGLAVLWQVAAGEVDASFDLYTSYAIWEKVLGKGQVGNLLWTDYGLPIYGHTYFVNTETVTKNPKLIERFLRAVHKGWRDAQVAPAEAIDAMAAAVPGLDRDTLLNTMPQILDLCITDRSRKNGIGWIEPELMAKTLEITFANAKPDKPVKSEDVFTNAFSSRIKPLK